MKQATALHWHSSEVQFGKSSQTSEKTHGQGLFRTLMLIVACGAVLAAVSGYRSADFDIDSAAFNETQREVLHISAPIVD